MAKDQNRSRIVLLCLVTVCAFILLACVAFLAVMMIRERQTPAPTGTVSTTVPETTAMTVETTEVTVETTETTEEPTLPLSAAQPAALTALLQQNGTTYEELEQKHCTQLVTVLSEGTTASIRFFACRDGQWSELPQLACEGYVGRSGVFETKQEGDGSTPSGLYSIGCGFYIHDVPETGLDLFQITQDTYWVDDPDSKFYNQRIEGTENKDWDSAEHMIDYSVYRYGFVVDYNLTAQYNAGSAIFFHISDRPTAGCIATEEEMVLAYLAQLDKEKDPYILIVNSEQTEQPS